MKRTITMLFLVATLLVTTACAINPATGKRQLVLIGEEQEIRLGLENDKQIVASLGLYDDEELQTYVMGLGTKLAATSERPSLNWTFRVVDDATVNAFALPGGYIYVTRGILAHLNSEAELCSVLGHEIGHVTARHGVNQMSKAQVFQIGLGLGMIFSEELRQYGGEAQQALGLLFLKFSRDDERQADDLGLRYLDRAGYDVNASPEVFKVLGSVGGSQEGGRAPSWTLTHPAPENRIERSEAHIAAMNADMSGRPLNQETYYGQVDGIVFGSDPREGYFEDNVFLHPDMAFRIEFPPGWDTRNSKQAVVAISTEEDAVVRLSVAAAATAREALDAFLAEEGVERGTTEPVRIAGMTSVSQGFRVPTDGGAIRGTVGFVEYRELVLKLWGYSEEANWSARGPAIERTISSFARLTDPDALNVQPKRVRIVEARKSMSLSEFAERHDATAPLETLALINHLAADARVEAGQSYKLVVGGS